MSEDIRPQEEAIEIDDLSSGKKFLLGGAGTLGGILVDAGMMHHNGVGGLIFGTALGVMAAVGYPVIRPMVDSVCKEFNGIAAKRQAQRDARRHTEAQPKDGEVTEPLRIEVLEETANEIAEMQLGPDQHGQDVLDRTLLIPRAPKFKDMCHLLGSDGLILCYTIDGPLYGTVLDLLSMAIVGKPGRGKTTALMYYVSMLLKNGAEVFIWDPHGTMGELALLNDRKLSNMPATARVVYLDRKDDMVDSVAILQEKLAERDEEYRRCVRAGEPYKKHPLLLLADELPVLADYDDQVEVYYKKLNKDRRNNEEDELEVPSLITVIRRIVLEARKWNCYFIGSGQSTDAQILPTRVTENLSSRIVFYSSDRRARMAGLEQEDVKKFLPILKRADPGTMVFDGSRFDAPVLGAIPEINAADMKAFLLGQSSQQQTLFAGGNASPDQPAALTIDQVLAFYNAGKLSDEAFMKLIDLLPTVQPAEDESADGEADTEALSPEVIDFQERSVRRGASPPKQEQAPVPRQPHAKYQRALAAWNEGHQSVRSMAAALGITESAAYKLMTDMDKLGLIQMKRKAK